MASSLSIKSIEQVVEKHRTQNHQIEDDKALQIANELKNHILNKFDDDDYDYDQGILVTLLAITLRLSKPNDGYYLIFSEPLIDEIFTQISNHNSIDVVNHALIILESIVNGVIFDSVPASQYAIPILNSTNTNLKTLETISNKIQKENVELMVNASSFVNGYLELDHVQFNSINHLAEFILHLQKSEFLVILGNLSLLDKFRKYLKEPMSRVQRSYQKNVAILMDLKIDLSSKYQEEVLNIVLNQVTKIGIDKEKELLLERFSVFHLIDLYFFLENTNITFKKSYHQQILFNSKKDQKFPLSLASLEVSNFLTAIFDTESTTKGSNVLQNYFFLRDLLQYNLIAKFLEIWVESKAELGDFENLFRLIHILLDEIIDVLSEEDDINPVDKIITICKESSYQKLRSIQLDAFKKHVNDVTNLETKRFNKILNDQTFDFVKNQRFLSLAQGSWVYSHLRSSKDSSTGNNNHSYYFIILSPNFKQILYKEFKTKQAEKPNIDKTGTSIDISSITNFEIEEILQVDKNAPPSSNSRLINLINKTVINKISLINRKNKVLFCFYAKKDESLVWLDGLNLLIGNYENLSNELKQQLTKLYSIRKSVQLLNFDKNLENELKENGKVEEDVNNLEFLGKLSENFYYT